jgi:phthalate 4,5-cis-dihydrodiol dehydrogenase
MVFNVGIIGAGSYGAQHAEAIAELGQVRLTAACRTNEEALQEFVGRYGGTGYTEYQDLLKDDEVDVVVIATPHHRHTAIAEEAARAGKHILLEKPMAPTLSDCDRIIQAVELAGVQLMMGHVNHFVPAYIAAKNIIDSGELGEIVLGISTMSKFWFEPNRRDWHLNRATGGGMWMTAGLHCLDRLTWLVDSPVQSVAAQFATRFHDQQADDAGMVFLRYASGAVGTVVSVGYSAGAPKHLTELTCTKGMMTIDYVDGVRIGRDEKWVQVPGTQAENWMHTALVNEWSEFIAALESGALPPVTGHFARDLMAVIFAAERSSAEKREIQLQPGRTD